MNDTTLLSVAELQRQVEQRVLGNAAKSRTPAEDIALALTAAARDLLLLAKLSDMQFARTEREMHEEASNFAAFLMEIARPLDLMLRNVMQTASDNVGVGGFSKYEADDLEKARIVTEALHNDWVGYFKLAAIGAQCDPEFYTKQFARLIELAGRK